MEGQAPDETPLPEESPLDVPTQHVDTAALLHSDLGGAEQGFADAVNEIHADVHGKLAAAETETGMIHHALAGTVGLKLNDAQDALHKVYATHSKALNKRMDTAQAHFLNNGVTIPGNALEAQADLADETGLRLLSRVPQFAAMMGPDPSAPPITPVPPLVPPPIMPGGGAVAPPIYIPPLPVAPPITPVSPCDQQFWQEPHADPTADPPWSCPPGYHLSSAERPGSWTCVPNKCFIPPSPPPPAVPPVSCVSPGAPTVMVSCAEWTPPPPPSLFWIAYECTPCGVKVCTYSGSAPPTGYKGTLLPQGWTAPPGEDVMQALHDLCHVPPVSPSPPTSPPTSPGSPPPALPPVLIGSPPSSSPSPPSPPPPPTITGNPYPPGLGYTDWNNPDVCKAVSLFCNAFGDTNPAGVAGEKLGAVWKTLSPPNWILDATAPLVDLVKTTTQDVLEKVGLADEISKLSIGTLSGRSFREALERDTKTRIPLATWGLASTFALADRGETITGLPLRYLAQGYLYSMQWCVPQLIPSQDGVDAMWMTNQIDSNTWECLTRANGNIPRWAEAFRNAKTQRPGMSELTQLYYRGLIQGKDALYTRAAEIGVKRTTDVNEFVKLAEQLPPMSDLVRFMVRDAADDDVAKLYQYDKDFDLKFSDKLKGWADAQGIPSDFMKMVWRSHWVIPSPTQLYMMFQRLRPDRPDVVGWDDEALRNGAAAAAAKFGPRPPIVTLADIKQALEVDDHAPAWIDALIAVSFNPITRTDAIRAFQLGDFTADDLLNAFQDTGLSPPDAKRMVKFYVAQSKRTLAQQAGVMSVRSIINAFKDGLLDRTDSDKALMDIVPDQAQRNTIMDNADREVTIEVKREKIKTIKRHFITGKYDAVTATDELVNIQVDAGRARELITQWQSLQAGRLREPTVRMLCNWRTHGIITDDDYLQRLQNLGWDYDDARNIADVCEADWQRAQLKAAASQAASMARKAKADERDKLRMLREAEAETRKVVADYKGILSDLQQAIGQAEKDAKASAKF